MQHGHVVGRLAGGVLRPAEHRQGRIVLLPAEVQAFTGEVLARNRERNRRLFRQLGDALLPLNAAGIEPVLLKGAAVANRRMSQGPRLISLQ